MIREDLEMAGEVPESDMVALLRASQCSPVKLPYRKEPKGYRIANELNARHRLFICQEYHAGRYPTQRPHLKNDLLRENIMRRLKQWGAVSSWKTVLNFVSKQQPITEATVEKWRRRVEEL